METDVALHAAAGTIIGEPGDRDLSDTPDSERERIPLPHAVSMFTLKSFTRGLWFGFDPNEGFVVLEDTMYRSQKQGRLNGCLILRIPMQNTFL